MIQKIIDDIRSRHSFGMEWLRKKILGGNNEKLDFLIDSFASLEPKQKQWAIAGAASIAVFAASMVFVIYFAKLNALDRDLDSAMSALVDLRQQKKEYQEYDAQFYGIIDTVGKATASLRMKPFFEEKSNAIGINMQGLQDQSEDLPSEDLLSSKLKFQRVDMRLPETSIPRLLNFILEIERSNRFVFLDDLQIRGRFGTKLFFDVSARFKGYTAK